MDIKLLKGDRGRQMCHFKEPDISNSAKSKNKFDGKLWWWLRRRFLLFLAKSLNLKVLKKKGIGRWSYICKEVSESFTKKINLRKEVFQISSIIPSNQGRQWTNPTKTSFSEMWQNKHQTKFIKKQQINNVQYERVGL